MLQVGTCYRQAHATGRHMLQVGTCYRQAHAIGRQTNGLLSHVKAIFRIDASAAKIQWALKNYNFFKVLQRNHLSQRSMNGLNMAQQPSGLPTARAYIRRGIVALGKGNYFVKLAEGAKFRLFFFDQNICVRPPDNRRRHASKFSHSLRGRQWYKKMVQGPEYSVTRFGEF